MELFIELHVLKMHVLIELRTAMIMHRANTGWLPVNLQTILAHTTKKANCLTKQCNGIKLTELGDHKISVPLRNGTVLICTAGTNY